MEESAFWGQVRWTRIWHASTHSNDSMQSSLRTCLKRRVSWRRPAQPQPPRRWFRIASRCRLATPAMHLALRRCGCMGQDTSLKCLHVCLLCLPRHVCSLKCLQSQMFACMSSVPTSSAGCAIPQAGRRNRLAATDAHSRCLRLGSDNDTCDSLQTHVHRACDLSKWCSPGERGRHHVFRSCHAAGVCPTSCDRHIALNVSIRRLFAPNVPKQHLELLWEMQLAACARLHCAIPCMNLG